MKRQKLQLNAFTDIQLVRRTYKCSTVAEMSDHLVTRDTVGNWGWAVSPLFFLGGGSWVSI